MVKVFGFGGFGENFKYQENFSDTNEGSYSYLFKVEYLLFPSYAVSTDDSKMTKMPMISDRRDFNIMY